MMFDGLISYTQDRLAKRKRYNSLVNEILSLSDRDLADIRGDRTEMLRHARRTVYG